MTDHLRVGVIGVNGIGQWHLWSLQQSERSAAAAVCDIDAARAEKAAADARACPPSPTRPRCSRAATSTRSWSRRPPGRTDRSSATRSTPGMHVYCEKPIAPTADEGYALARHAHEAQRTLQVGFQFRFHKGYAALRAARRAISAPLARVNLTATNWFRAQAYFDASPWRATWSDGRRRRADEPGDPPARRADRDRRDAGACAGAVRAYARTVPRSRTTRSRCSSGRSGATGVLVASLSDPAGDERFEFFGDRGAVVLEDGYDVRIDRARRRAAALRRVPRRVPRAHARVAARSRSRARREEWLDCLVDAHRDFAAAVLDGAAPVGRRRRRARAASSSRTRSTCRRSRIASVELPLERGEYLPWYEELVAGGSRSEPRTGRRPFRKPDFGSGSLPPP